MKILPSFASQFVSNYDPSASADVKAASRTDAASRPVPVEATSPRPGISDGSRGSAVQGTRRQLRLISKAVRSGLRSVVRELEQSDVGRRELKALRGEIKGLYSEFRRGLREGLRDARSSGDRGAVADAVRRSFGDLLSGLRATLRRAGQGSNESVDDRIDAIVGRFASLYDTLSDVLEPADPRVERAISAYEA